MQIIADATTRVYELTYLISASFTDSEKGKLNEEIASLIKKHKANISETQDWGKRKLAYKIKFNGAYQTEAIYTHIVFESLPANVQLLERDIYLNPQIIRHLLVVAEPVKAPKSKQAE